MKRLIVILCLAVMLSFTASSVWALSYYTPTVTDLHSWDFIAGVNVQLPPGSWDSSNGQKITINFNIPQDGSYAIWGKDYSSPIDLSSYDMFVLSLENKNENPWEYQLYMKDNDGTEVYTAIQTLPIYTPTTFTLKFSDYGALDKSNISVIGFKVGGDVPIDGENDYTNETIVSPVPEPATIMLMGAGLLGIGSFARRRHSKKS